MNNHGHAAGDQVLKDVARTIIQAVGETGIVGRYGGEEFCIILPRISVDDAKEVAEKVRVAICQELAEPYKVTSSFGVASASFGGASFQAMLEQADQALYSAKRGGRNAVRCWSPELVEEIAAESDQRAKELRIPLMPINRYRTTQLLRCTPHLHIVMRTPPCTVSVLRK